MLQSLSPGAVKTEFFIAAGHQDLVSETLSQIPWLESKDIADAVLYILGTPPHVQVWISLKHETLGAPMYSNTKTTLIIYARTASQPNGNIQWLEGLQKVDSNMAPSETFIRDRGISVFMMSDVREVT